MGYRDLEEVLEIIPGFSSTQTRYGALPTGTRGVTNIRQGGKLLVLLDGTPYNDVMYGSSIFFGATFNLDAVERIEVIRGPGSALYGRNAFSGVINIITKQAKQDNRFELGASAGSYNTYDGRLAYNLKRDQVGARIDAKYYSTDGTNSKYNNGEGGESTWNLPHDNIYINGNIQYKNFSFFGSFSRREDGNSPATSLGDFITDGSTVFNIGTYNLSYAKQVSSNTRIHAKLYGRNEYRTQDIALATPRTIDTFYIEAIDSWIPFNAVYPEGGYAEPVFSAYTYGAELEAGIQLLKNNNLLVGLQGDFHGIANASVRSNYNLADNLPIVYDDNGTIRQYSKENMPVYEPGWILNGGHDYINAAVYLQDVHNFRENLSLTLGGRLDYDSEVGLILNPRLGMVWEPGKNNAIKLLYGKAYRAPTTNEQYKIMGFDLGNKNLKHENIHTFELALGSKTGKLYSELSLYYNLLDNLILQLDTASGTNVKSYYNVGNNTSYGLELEVKYLLNKRIFTFANYSYTNSTDYRDTESGEINQPHPNIPQHIVNLGINANITSRINWSILARYKGPIQKYLVDDTFNRNTYVSQDVVGDFLLLNSTLLFSDIFKGFDLSIQGYNLLNRVYYYQDNIYAHQPAQKGRHFLVRLYFNFDL